MLKPLSNISDRRERVAHHKRKLKMLSEGVLTAFSKEIDDGVPLVPLLPSKEITRLASIKDTLQLFRYYRYINIILQTPFPR